MNALLRAKDVTKTYEKAQHPSLNNISFSVAAGEFIGIMGASGSGKTTLLNVLSTIDTPTSGEIWINGINIRQLNNTGAADFRKDHLGFIFQEYFLLDSLTIRENISVPLTLQKLPPRKIETMVQNLAERFGIASQLDKYPDELSGSGLPLREPSSRSPASYLRTNPPALWIPARQPNCCTRCRKPIRNCTPPS